LITSGRAGGTTTPGGGGPSTGVGSAKPIEMKSCRLSNRSVVSGPEIDSESMRDSPVEVPNGSTSRPAVRYSGKRCVSPSVMVARSTLMRSTLALAPLTVGNSTLVPGS
jgi:hypothetical protein